MTKPILNIDAIPDSSWMPWSRGDKFEARLGQVAAHLGAKKLGYNITIVPPGKRSFPHHNHNVNEEMFFILEGEAELRFGEERHAVRVGDIIACPPGGPEVAHQLINTSKSTDLKYLAVSTTESPEVAHYPDSSKYGIMLTLPGERRPDGRPNVLRFFAAEQGSMDDYWQGEE